MRGPRVGIVLRHMPRPADSPSTHRVVQSTRNAARTTNRVIATLPFLEWRRLEPHLELVELPTGAMLYESGVVLQHVYFPATAVVSLVSSMQDGASVEVAVVGSEGVVGVCAFMGAGTP